MESCRQPPAQPCMISMGSTLHIWSTWCITDPHNPRVQWGCSTNFTFEAVKDEQKYCLRKMNSAQNIDRFHIFFLPLVSDSSEPEPCLLHRCVLHNPDTDAYSVDWRNYLYGLMRPSGDENGILWGVPGECGVAWILFWVGLVSVPRLVVWNSGILKALANAAPLFRSADRSFPKWNLVTPVFGCPYVTNHFFVFY